MVLPFGGQLPPGGKDSGTQASSISCVHHLLFIASKVSWEVLMGLEAIHITSPHLPIARIQPRGHTQLLRRLKTIFRMCI